MAIDTACSSSLVALGTARNALLLGVSAEALAGGITLMLSPTTMAMYAVAGDAPCRPALVDVRLWSEVKLNVGSKLYSLASWC